MALIVYNYYVSYNFLVRRKETLYCSRCFGDKMKNNEMMLVRNQVDGTRKENAMGEKRNDIKR